MKNKENIIKLLKKKLDWYTYEASPEEFSPEEVEAILTLLTTLEPIPESQNLNTDEALNEFMKLYANPTKKQRRSIYPALKIGIAAILFILFVVTATTFSSYATGNMGFFKFLSKSDKGWSFMITGEQSNTYQTWNDLPSEIGKSICIPCTPMNFDLKNIMYTESDDTFNLYVTYENSSDSIKLSICNRMKEYGDSHLITSSNGINIYTSSNAYYFNVEDCYYELSGNIADANTAITLINELFP